MFVSPEDVFGLEQHIDVVNYPVTGKSLVVQMGLLAVFTQGDVTVYALGDGSLLNIPGSICGLQTVVTKLTEGIRDDIQVDYLLVSSED